MAHAIAQEARLR